MNWFSNHWPHLWGAMASAGVVLVKVNAILQKAEHIIPDTVWAYAWAWVTGKPLKREPQHETGKGGSAMTLQEIEATTGKILDNVCKLEEKVGPILKLAMPQFAPELALADLFARGVDTLIQAHNAAGATPQANSDLVFGLLNLMAGSGVVNQGASDKIKAIAAVAAPAVASIPAEVQAANNGSLGGA